MDSYRSSIIYCQDLVEEVDIKMGGDLISPSTNCWDRHPISMIFSPETTLNFLLFCCLF